MTTASNNNSQSKAKDYVERLQTLETFYTSKVKKFASAEGIAYEDIKTLTSEPYYKLRKNEKLRDVKHRDKYKKISEIKNAIDNYNAILKLLKQRYNRDLIEKNDGSIIKKEETTLINKYKEHEFSNKIKNKKEKKNELRDLYSGTAHRSSAALAIGEGFVAGISFYHYLNAIPLLAITPAPTIGGIVCGIGGGYCNYYLVKDNLYGMLNSIFPKNGDKGLLSKIKEDSKLKYHSCMVLGMFSAATGLCYGALSAECIYGPLKLWMLKIVAAKTTATLMASVTAAFPVAFTMIAMAALFYFVISDFIKNDRWKGIKDWWYYYIVDEERWSMKAFNILKSLLMVMMIASLTVLSFGLFHKSILNFMSSLFGYGSTPSKPMKIMAYIATIMQTLSSGPFNMKNICNVIINNLTYNNLKKPLCANVSETRKRVKLLNGGVEKSDERNDIS